MRILEVSNFMPPHPGGIEIMIDTLFQGLQRRGHDVRWIAASTPLEPGTTGPFVRVPAWNWLEQNLHVPMPLWAPSGWRQLDEQVRWADVIHVHDCLYFSSSLTTALTRGRRKPLLVTQHVGEVPYGGVLDWVQAAAYRTLGRTLLSAASEVVTLSPHVAEYFRKVGVKKPLRIIPMGFEPRFQPLPEAERLTARREFGLPETTPLMLFAARLVPKKGVQQVAEVQRRLALEGITLVVAGDGPLANVVEGLPRTVHLRQVDHARMHALYACADVLLLPSRGEGLPLTLQEGLMTGLPAVVSTDPSFVANVASAPGVTLVDGTEPLAQAIRTALTSSPSREHVAEWARARWGLERFVTDYERTLERLAREH
ncbi:glycosyltransferase family 4 protein [Myxococcus qinghaiensis]|uniref:glycosyltransferase family 4 protein n=1 Tax=Myxococcus qinghaiensis TaxID=2906758 RepID=UPI0020A7850E|nr:glycosyltransferase family 4 protein [Myxococcus qinghaiensis]MCP3164444.1 glycosyltransferase family 4 protein [Myxococcus qinghaiensis]